MRDDDARAFRERLRELRNARHLSQEEFAEIASLNYKHYQEIERGGKKEVRFSTLVKLAKALGIPLYQLFTSEPAASVAAETAPEYPAKRKPPASKKPNPAGKKAAPPKRPRRS